MNKKQTPPILEERNNYADIVRVCACVAVIVMHVTGNIGPLSLQFTHKSWWFAYIITSSTRWCVPVFVMLSGALLLPPNKNEPLALFFKKRIKRVVLPLLVWSSVYYAWRYFWHGEEINLTFICKTFIIGKPYYHLFFLFLIFGLYLITPILKIYLRSAASADRKFFIFTTLLLAWIYSILQYFIFSDRFLNSLNAVTLFIPFIGYYILGYHISIEPRKASISLLKLLFIICLLINILGTVLLIKAFGSDQRFAYMLCYVAPTVILMSFLVFTMLRISGAEFLSSKPLWFQNVCSKASRATLGVYLIHPMILDILGRYPGLSGYQPSLWLGIPITIIVTTVICFVIIIIAQRIPYANYIIG
jgi:surface polysaccharide O-acyltransferase-like enzyme